MDESQDHWPSEEETTYGRLVSNWRSCLLLTVMMLGILATPLAVFYRWYGDRRQTGLSLLEGENAHVNRIALVTRDYQLATIAPDGSRLRHLTDLNQRVEFPAWAPDGSALAVIAGTRVYLLEDVVASPGTARLNQLYESTTEPPFYLYWSPDSRYLSFLASHSEKGIVLQLATPGEQNAEVVSLASGQPFYWEWAAAADEMFIHSGDSGSEARLEVIDLKGEISGGRFGYPGYFQAPGTSPEGRYRAFALLDEDNRSVLAVWHREGDQQFYDVHPGQLALAWSPTDELLAYATPLLAARRGGGPLQLLDPATGESRVLSHDSVLAYFWSPDGKTIAYFTPSRQDDDNVRVAEMEARRLILSRRLRQPGQFQMELWAVEVESGAQRLLTRFVPSGLFLRQFLPYFDQYALSHRIWSPDSTALVIPVIEDGRTQIALVPLSHGPARLITDGEIAFWSHQ